MTDDEEIAQAVRIFRNYGSEKRYYNKVVGANSRLDEMQAGLINMAFALCLGIGSYEYLGEYAYTHTYYLHPAENN